MAPRLLILLLLLSGCSGLSSIEPAVYQVPLQGSYPDLVVASDSIQPDLPVVYGYPVHSPKAVVVLVHGLGTRAALWDLPETGRLARRVWRAGYAVYTLDLNFSEAPDSLAVTRKNLRDVVQAIARTHRNQKVFGIGHDIGGTLLYQVLAESGSKLDGVIGVGAQVGFGGYSKAVQALLDAGDAQSQLMWPMLDALTVSKSSPGDVSVSELLLSSSLPEKTRMAFYKKALSKIPASLLQEIGALGKAEPVPVLDPFLALNEKRMIQPVLAIMAPSDGLAPPWQCDPGAFGLSRQTIRSVYLTRANGESMEYNHLDMLLHPLASREVFPLVMDWLSEHSP